MHHELYLSSDGLLNPAIWTEPHPAGYTVAIDEFRRRSVTDPGELVPNLWTIAVTLQHSGVVEWVASKAYDHLWTYLSQLAAKKEIRPSGVLTIESAVDKSSTKVVIPQLDDPTIKKAKLKMTSMVEASGAVSNTIEIDLSR